MAASPASKRPRREEIEIRLPSRKRFARGTAPRQPGISLLPVCDSTAFIADKIIYPATPAIDKETRRRLCYIVGWTDLPAARILIPCTRVLDYVSPRMLEEWEYNDSLRREEDEWAQAIEEAKLISLGRDPAEAAVPAQSRPKKRRGRPPRAALMDVAPPTPVLAAEDKALIAKKKAAGPSLTTPQKRRLEELTEVESDYDLDVAVQRQLFGDPDDMETDAPEQPASAGNVSEEGMELEGGRAGNRVQDVERSSRGGSAGPVAASQLPATSSPSRGIRAVQRLTVASSTVKRKRGSDDLETSPRGQLWNDGASSSSPVKPPPPKTQKRRHNDELDERASASQSSTPAPDVPSRQGRANGASHASHPTSFTPAAASPSAPPTPVPAVAFPSPRVPDARRGEVATVLAAANADPPFQVKQRSRKPKQQPEAPAYPAPDSTGAPAEEDRAWEVRRLEGDRLAREEDGSTKRYFKVRWKGDWPPDENPTWEPEENITRSLVNKYLKKKASREAERAAAAPAAGSSAKTSRKAQKTLSPWTGKKYASVTEAFQDGGEGDSAGLEEDLTSPFFEGEEEPGDDRDEFTVTEERTSPTRSTQRARSSLDVDLARQYRTFSHAGEL